MARLLEPLFVFEDEPTACWITADEMDAYNYAVWALKELNNG